METADAERKESEAADAVPAESVRVRLGEYIDQAMGGKRVRISRNGKVRVAIVSIADVERLERLDAEAPAA